MSEESLIYKKFFQLFKFPHEDLETFTWKIPNVSSIPQTVDYVVQSPSFSFGESDWILKMYSYVQTEERSQGYIDIALERLYSQVKEEDIFVKIFSEDVFGRKFYNQEGRYLFESKNRRNVIFSCITQNLQNNPEKWRIAHNDTFKFVCAMQYEQQKNSPTKSSQQNLYKRYRASKDEEITEIGEICKDYLAMACFMVKICSVEPVPAGCKIHVPISFANASWILKIYPHFRMKNSYKPSTDIVLERFHSEISEHYVVLKISMTLPTETTIEQSFFFNACHTQGTAINFQNPAEGYDRPCIHFDMEISAKRIGTSESLSRTKSTKPDEGDSSVAGSSAVLRNIKELYLKQTDCDVVFKVKGKKFPAHRLILKAQSPVLASAFRLDMKEKATGIYDVEDCEPSVFSDFLLYLYSGEVENLTKDNAFGLFTVADKYVVPHLRDMCMKFIKRNLSVETFCDAIALAKLHSESELVKLSTDFFVKNSQEIIITDKWQRFIVENPTQGKELMSLKP